MHTSKTIHTTPEVHLPTKLFCQPIDIGIDLLDQQIRAINSMEDYPVRSEQNAILHIHDLLKYGIQTVMLRMDAPKTFSDHTALLDRQADILKNLRAHFPSDQLTVIADPFSVALNQDRTWGVHTDGKLDYDKTAKLFAQIATTFNQAGADYILALGRFEREVAVAQEALGEHHASTSRIASFSTNTETTNAYVYADHDTYKTTGQKILVSNINEMVFRALVDIYEGTQLVVIKPSENLHVIERLRTLLTHPQLLARFLQSDLVVSMLTNPHLKHVHAAIIDDVEGFLAESRRCALGAYTVSGTYFTDMQTLRRKGDAFLQSVLYERFCNIAATLQEWPGGQFIVDRNAFRFVSNQTE
jgi:porphobilinogen synthase